jgi:hypothetical protein
MALDLYLSPALTWIVGVSQWIVYFEIKPTVEVK